MNGYAPEAYSMLGLILAQQNVSVLSLQRKLAQLGMAVNIKSLYRLVSDLPVQKIDLHIAAAVCKVCGIELGDLIRFQKPKAQLRRLEEKAQSRLDVLMAKNNEGQLTAAERKEFGALADRAHRISLENARTLLAEQRRAKKPAGAKRKASTLKHAEASA